MLGLPKATEIKKIIPKSTIFTKFQMNTASRERFDTDIRRVTLVNEVSPSTVAIAAGSSVSSFFVVLVSLKKREYEERNITLLSKLINQNMLFVLEYEGEAQLAVYRQKLMTSGWQAIDDLEVALSGLDFDAVWENIIVHIGQVEITGENTLDEQIREDEEMAKLQREIEKLEKQARRESNPRKKFELAQKVKLLQNRL